jgi:hypothetical protein
MSAGATVPSNDVASLNRAVSHSILTHEQENVAYCRRVWRWLCHDQGKLESLQALTHGNPSHNRTIAGLATVLTELTSTIELYASYCPGPYRDSVLLDVLVTETLPALQVAISRSGDDGGDDTISDDVSELGDGSVSEGRGGGRVSGGSSRKQVQRQTQLIARLQRDLAVAKEAMKRTSQADVTMLNTKIRGYESDMTRLKHRNMDLRDRVQMLEKRLYESVGRQESLDTSASQRGLSTPGSVVPTADPDLDLASPPDFLRRAQLQQQQSARRQKKLETGAGSAAKGETPELRSQAVSLSLSPHSSDKGFHRETTKQTRDTVVKREEEHVTWSELVKRLPVTAPDRRTLEVSVRKAMHETALTNANVIRCLEKEVETLQAQIQTHKRANASPSIDIDAEADADSGGKLSAAALDLNAVAVGEASPRMIEKVLEKTLLVTKDSPAVQTQGMDLLAGVLIGASVMMVIALLHAHFRVGQRFWVPLERSFCACLNEYMEKAVC